MTFRIAFLVLLGAFTLLFGRILFRGEVIFPHDNALEAGEAENSAPSRLSNRKFSDESSAFIPELVNALDSKNKAWLSTWNPAVELGRPAFHVSGLSRAYALTNLVSAFTRDAFVVYTALVLLTVGLTSVFQLLFLRALGIHPAACLLGALGLGFCSALMYWLTFLMFLSAICWSVCLLWLIMEFIRENSWPAALGLAFATYSLLLTGYPQMTILLASMVGLFTLVRLAEVRVSGKKMAWSALRLLGCAMAGGLASLPVYFDLMEVARDSARLRGVSDSFFLAVLPSHDGFGEIAGFLTTIFDWSWPGNAIAPVFPARVQWIELYPRFRKSDLAFLPAKTERRVVVLAALPAGLPGRNHLPVSVPVCGASSRVRFLPSPIALRRDRARFRFERFHG